MAMAKMMELADGAGGAGADADAPPSAEELEAMGGEDWFFGGDGEELTAAQKRELEEDELLEVGGDPSFLPDFAPDADAGWDGEIDEEAHFDPID